MSNLPELLFSVPRGFEDVAAADILRFLPVQRDHFQITYTAATGLVRLRFLDIESLGLCLQAYDAGSFWAVIRCTLSIGDPMTISLDLFQKLTEERQALPSKRSRIIAEPGVNKARLSKRRTKLAPLLADTTAGESELLNAISELVHNRQDNFVNILEIWKQFKHGPQASPQSPESFAARAERREFLLPTLKSNRVAEMVGSQLADTLCMYTGKEKQKVDLINPDLEVLVEFVNEAESQNAEVWSIQYGIILPAPRQLPPHRSFSRIYGRTSLLPQRAYCLCLLHPYLSPHTVQKSVQRTPSIFMDPCSGFGSIPMELSAMSARDQLQILPLAADNELPSLENAFKNYTAARTSKAAGLVGVDNGFVWDARGRGRSGGLRLGLLDGMCSDLPFGIRELSTRAVNALYPALLRTLAEAAADGAYAVFLCGAKKQFDNAMLAVQDEWELCSERAVNVEGIRAFVIILRRLERTLNGMS